MTSVIFYAKELQYDGHINFIDCSSRDGKNGWIEPTDARLFLLDGGYSV